MTDDTRALPADDPWTTRRVLLWLTGTVSVFWLALATLLWALLR